MPRVKLCVPEVDKLKGLVLERQNALGYSEGKMAKVFNVSPVTYRKRMTEPSENWTVKEIKSVCLKLGIPKEEWRAAI